MSSHWAHRRDLLRPRSTSHQVSRQATDAAAYSAAADAEHTPDSDKLTLRLKPPELMKLGTGRARRGIRPSPVRPG